MKFLHGVGSSILSSVIVLMLYSLALSQAYQVFLLSMDYNAIENEFINAQKKSQNFAQLINNDNDLYKDSDTGNGTIYTINNSASILVEYKDKTTPQIILFLKSDKINSKTLDRLGKNYGHRVAHITSTTITGIDGSWAVNNTRNITDYDMAYLLYFEDELLHQNSINTTTPSTNNNQSTLSNFISADIPDKVYSFAHELSPGQHDIYYFNCPLDETMLMTSFINVHPAEANTASDYTINSYTDMGTITVDDTEKYGLYYNLSTPSPTIIKAEVDVTKNLFLIGYCE